MKMPKALVLGGSVLVIGAGSSLLIFQGQQIEPSTTNEVVSAPAPAKEFMDYQCSTPDSLPEDTEIAPGSWLIPSLGVSASFIPSDTLPADSIDNAGIIYSHSEAIESPEGTSLLVGHVDFQPGVKSEKGGELTAWGYLHQLKACDLVYTRAADGTLIISQVTSIIVTPQFDPELEARALASPDDEQLSMRLKEQRDIESRVFRATGDKKITLMTCSGPSVEDVGGDFQFRYADNLIIETTPIEQY